jgi:hypothetical protein
MTYSPAEHIAGRLVMGDHLQKTTERRHICFHSYVENVKQTTEAVSLEASLHGGLLKLVSIFGE